MKSSVKNVIKLKTEIAEELRKQPRRIFVTVDDIDRLNPEEIRQLFGVIKSVADFPNVVYLLTFDKKVVIEALRESQGISGENYLEKIVQFPFELPLPDRSSLSRLLFARLESIMAGTPEGLFDQTYWGNVFMRGIEHFISTPRKINLLTNTLSVTYPAVQGEVNPVDFIGIETLRIFCPEAYNMIRTYPEKFTGREWVASKIDQLRTFQESWVTQIVEENREAVRGMLSQLFPKLGEMWGDLGFEPPMSPPGASNSASAVRISSRSFSIWRCPRETSPMPRSWLFYPWPTTPRSFRPACWSWLPRLAPMASPASMLFWTG